MPQGKNTDRALSEGRDQGTVVSERSRRTNGLLVLLRGQSIGTAAQAVSGLIIVLALSPSERGAIANGTTVPLTIAALFGGGFVYGATFYIRQGAATVETALRGALLSVGLLCSGAGAWWLLYSIEGQPLMRGIPALPPGVAALAVPFLGAYLFVTQLVQGLGRERQFARAVAIQAVTVAASWACLAVTQSLTVQSATLAWYGSFVAAGIALYTRRLRGQNAVGGRFVASYRQIGTFSAKAYVATTMQQMAFRLDLVLVAAVLSSEQLGYYAFATSIAELTWIPMLAMAQLQWSRGLVSDATKYFRALLPLGVSCSTVAAAVALAGAWLLTHTVARAYSPAVPVVALLLPGTVAAAVFRVTNSFFLSTGRPETTAKIALIGGLVAILAYPIGVRVGGVIGAAVASTVVYALQAVAALWIVGETRSHVLAFWRPASSRAAIRQLRALEQSSR